MEQNTGNSLDPKQWKEFYDAFYDLYLALEPYVSRVQFLQILGVLLYLKGRHINFNFHLAENASDNECFNSICSFLEGIVNTLDKDTADIQGIIEDIKSGKLKIHEVSNNVFGHEVLSCLCDSNLAATYRLCSDIFKELTPSENVEYNGFLKYTLSLDKWDINMLAAAGLYYYSILSFFMRGKTEDGIWIAPFSIQELLFPIIKEYAYKDIYNPFCGIGDIVSIFFGNKVNYYANETSKDIYKIAQLHASLAGLNISGITNKSIVEIWPKDKQFDAIISIPPFGCRIIQDNCSMNLEGWFLRNAIRCLKPGGTIVAVFSLTVIKGRTFASLRKEITDAGLLDSIYLLPPKLFTYTNIPTVMIVLKKDRTVGEPVMMVNTHKGAISKDSGITNSIDVLKLWESIEKKDDTIVRFRSIEDISSTDYLWNPLAYTYLDVEVPKGYECLKLKDIIRMCPGRRPNVGMGKCLGIKELNEDPFDYTLDISAIKERELLSKEVRSYKMVDFPVLLVSSFKMLKPTFCNASKELPIHYGAYIFSFKVDTSKITLDYLVYKLATLDSTQIFANAVNQRIGYEDIDYIPIVFPKSITQQLEIVQEARKSAQLLRVKELGAMELIESIKEDYIMEVRHRKHDMKTPMTQLRNTLALLEMFAEELPDNQSAQLRKYIDRQKVAMNNLSEIVRHLADEDVFAQPEIVNIEDILKEQQIKTSKYTVVYRKDEASLEEAGISQPTVMIGRVDFIRLVQNILSNAIKHGFIGVRNDYELDISLAVEEDYFVISFLNNGTPLPDGMSKQRFGTKGAKGKDSDGSGLGGYIIKSITQHYRGDYDIKSYDINGVVYTVSIVKLPIYRSDE